MVFEKKCTRSNGELRRTLNLWQVPKDTIGRSLLHDGDIIEVSLKMDTFYHTFKTALGSGLEIYLPKLEAIRLRAAAEITINPVAVFTLTPLKTLEEANTDLDYEIAEAHKLTEVEVSELAQQAPPYPEKKVISITVFRRNANVIVDVLNRAGGKCEKCKRSAPFRRSKDNSPYLEVHHTIRLADSGRDRPDNAQALCPNCHREAHYG